MLYVKYKKERRYKMKKIKEISFFCMVLVVSLIFSEKVFAVSNVSPTSLTYFVEKLDIPVYEQQKNYYCGPANIKMVVQYLEGSSDNQSVYANYMGTDSYQETNAYDMYRALNHYTSKSWVETWHYDLTTSSFANLVKSNIDSNKPLILNTVTTPLYVYNGVGLSHYITVSGYSYPASFGDSDWYQYLYYVDPYRANYGNGTTYGEHQDTVSNVFSSVNHTYGIVIH